MELGLMGGVVLLILISITIAGRKFIAVQSSEEQAPTRLGQFLANKWYVDELYDLIIVKPVNLIAAFFSKVVDQKLIDGLVNGVGKGVQFSARQLRWLQSGQTGSYVLIMTISIILFFIFQLFWKA
jgi:NADH-quinone oxidoreductase subunit L